MDFDIKGKIEELVKQIGGDQNLLEQFKKDPIGAVKGLLGNVNLPTEQLEPLVAGIKAKLNLDQAGGILGSLGGLFGKK
jgi:hypothetical protein